MYVAGIKISPFLARRVLVLVCSLAVIGYAHSMWHWTVTTSFRLKIANLRSRVKVMRRDGNGNENWNGMG